MDTHLMECTKCKIEIKETDSKFCPNCGENIKNKEVDLIELYEGASGFWFLLGKIYGTLKIKKDNDGIRELEDFFKKYNFYDDYNKALMFAENYLLKLSKSKLNDEGQKESKVKAHGFP
ncbi:hypothetical protein KAS08_02545 [Candidatus Pacearchaeota archaeon]|nr:hypothetical protein [Candidatus Pacearchaeota archaeon]